MSLLPTFYPSEAEGKGAKPSQVTFLKPLLSVTNITHNVCTKCYVYYSTALFLE